MIKKRFFSIHQDFKTGLLCKLFLLIGIILLLVFIFIKVATLFVGEDSTGFARQIYDFSQSSYPNSILAISIIILAVAVIFYFFYCQFVKLGKIADEIEDDFDESAKK